MLKLMQAIAGFSVEGGAGPHGVVLYFPPSGQSEIPSLIWLLESEVFTLESEKKFRYSWNFEFTHLFRPLKDVGGLDY